MSLIGPQYSVIIRKVAYVSSTDAVIQIQPCIYLRLEKNTIATFSIGSSAASRYGSFEWPANIEISLPPDEDKIISVDLYDSATDGAPLVGIGLASLSSLSQSAYKFSIDIFSIQDERKEILGLVELILQCTAEPNISVTSAAECSSSANDDDRVIKFLQDFESRQTALWSSVQTRLEDIEKKVAYYLHFGTEHSRQEPVRRDEFERVQVSHQLMIHTKRYNTLYECGTGTK
jgi:hypothetical protein